VTAAELKAALRRHHAAQGDGAWVCVDEAFGGWASMGGGIDLLAVGVWKSARAPGLAGITSVDTDNPLVAYEVKVSRADFRRELYGYTPGPNAKWRTRAVLPWPAKAQPALDRTHYFVFAVPAGLLKADEVVRRGPDEGLLYVPEGVGLVVVDGGRVHVKVKAEPRSPRTWTRHETAELLRRVDTCARREAMAA
jgi:hypothetical protein